MAPPRWAPPEIDTERASASRMYDYFLGGSHNFRIDREVAEKTRKHMPDLPELMQVNRAFLRRAVRHCVAAGIDQFLDLGSGIPTVGNVHEVAQQRNPAVRVVYVDADPVAIAHSRAILTGNIRATAIQADLRDPDSVLGHPELRRLLDLTRPVALLMVAVLHFVPDACAPAEVIGRFRAALAPGSRLVISHGSYGDSNRPEIAEAIEVYVRAGTPFLYRTREEITAFFEGFEPVDPGIVQLPLWRPERGDRVGEEARRFPGFAGVGRLRHPGSLR